MISQALGWTDERVELLRKLWMQGLSASQCARALGGITRNAAIGKLYRMGCARPMAAAPTDRKPYPLRDAPKGQRRGDPKPKVANPRLYLPTASKAAPAPDTSVESPNAAPWMDRQPNECAYPVGDAIGADTVSCCNPADDTYCAGHRKIMYQPSQPRPLTARDAGMAGLNFQRPPLARKDDRFSSWLAA